MSDIEENAGASLADEPVEPLCPWAGGGQVSTGVSECPLGEKPAEQLQRSECYNKFAAV